VIHNVDSRPFDIADESGDFDRRRGEPSGKFRRFAQRRIQTACVEIEWRERIADIRPDEKISAINDKSRVTAGTRAALGQ
jgi:hypothetical protein